MGRPSDVIEVNGVKYVRYDLIDDVLANLVRRMDVRRLVVTPDVMWYLYYRIAERFDEKPRIRQPSAMRQPRLSISVVELPSIAKRIEERLNE